MLSYPTSVLLEPIIREMYVSTWQIIVLLLCVVLLGFIKSFNVNRFGQVYKSIFSYQISSEIVRGEKVFYHRVNLILTTIHMLIVGLLIYQWAFEKGVYVYEDVKFSSYLKITFLLLLLYVTKYIFARILAVIFDKQSLASEYIFTVALYNSMQGVLLIPIMLIIYFMEINFSFILQYLVFPVIGVTYLLRFNRLFIVGRSKSVSYFYIFLYICTLEILPLVVLIKIFVLR